MGTIITTRVDGEYSTTVYGNVIETVWFGNDGTSEVVGKSIIFIHEYAHNHIAMHESRTQ